MITLLTFLLAALGSVVVGFAFGETTSANANTGGYTAIPQVVRDLYSREVMFKAQPRLRFCSSQK